MPKADKITDSTNIEDRSLSRLVGSTPGINYQYLQSRARRESISKIRLWRNQWKGEPNFTPKAPTKHANNENFTTKKYLFLINSSNLFLIFWSKVRAFRHVVQIFETNTLNSIYNKHLHKYITTTYQIRARSFTRLRRKIMQNEPNLLLMYLKVPTTDIRNTIYAIRDYSYKTNPISTTDIRNTIYAIRDYSCKTNPI